MSEFEISQLDGGKGLKVVGELDIGTAPRLDEAVHDTPSEDEFVLDLSELTFLDSCGMRSILELARTRNGNGPLVILDPSRAVSRVFDIVGIDQHPGLELRRTTPPPAAASDGPP
jgi:anti-anti-sigma factor